MVPSRRLAKGEPPILFYVGEVPYHAVTEFHSRYRKHPAPKLSVMQYIQIVTLPDVLEKVFSVGYIVSAQGGRHS